MSHLIFRNLLFLILPLISLYCKNTTMLNEQSPNEPGFIEISYQLAQVTDPVPTYQTVIWLETRIANLLSRFLSVYGLLTVDMHINVIKFAHPGIQKQIGRT